jgi:hypothetical protein
VNSIPLGEKAVYGGIVVGIIRAVAGVAGDWSIGSNLLFDPFPITQVAIWQWNNVSFPRSYSMPIND